MTLPLVLDLGENEFNMVDRVMDARRPEQSQLSSGSARAWVKCALIGLISHWRRPELRVLPAYSTRGIHGQSHPQACNSLNPQNDSCSRRMNVTLLSYYR